MSDIMLVPENGELSVVDVRKQIAKMQELMKSVMQEGVHYGKIPGVEKASLYKPGAEKICFTFRLIAEFKYYPTILENGHREYLVECSIYTMLEHKLVGQGVGICSTMESKYRYRNDVQILEEDIPEDYWKDNKQRAAYNKQGFAAKKINGVWRWCKQTGERTENPDIADQYNTVIKMAEKRAYVDATIRATAASDVFTQDVEDMSESDLSSKPANQKPNNKPALKEPNNTAGNIWTEINKLPGDLRQSFAKRFRENPTKASEIIKEIQEILNPQSVDKDLDEVAEEGFNQYVNKEIAELKRDVPGQDDY